MNCVFVINTNQYLCKNARESIQAACARWNADYHEVLNYSLPNHYPCFMKSGAVMRLKGYSRIAYFDADMLIRSDAPNCFEVFGDPAKFYAVRDITLPREWVPHHFRSNFIESVRAPYHRPLRETLGREISFKQYVDNFFNAGFFICSPGRHERLFEFVQSYIPGRDNHYRGNGHYEQALFNYSAQLLIADELEFVDETWNFIDPNLQVRPMQKFIYHFTGAMSYQLKAKLNEYPWQS